jgi:succinyl-CoA synthetase beta subunit
VPVLEGTRSGLRALAHLMAAADRRTPPIATMSDVERQRRWRARLAAGPLSAHERFALLADYGVGVVVARPADHEGAVLDAAGSIGYPVVLKTGADVAHKTEVGGVVVGLGDDAELTAAYRTMSGQLGPSVVVCREVPPGVEVLLGAVRDPSLGMMLVLGAGGVLVEQLDDRATALPPVDPSGAAQLLRRTTIGTLLAAPRGRQPADLAAVCRAVASLSALVAELGDRLAAIEVNPLICTDQGAIAVDVHVELLRMPTTAEVSSPSR